MRIGIDARPLSHKLTGIGFHLLNILRVLEKIDQTNEYFLYSNDEIKHSFNNPRWRVKVIGNSPYNILGVNWIFFEGACHILWDRIEVFWAPSPLIPFFLPVKKVLTIHDFVWVYYPQTMEISNLSLNKRLSTLSIINANAIFSVSQATLKSLHELIPNKTKNVAITYNAVNSNFFPREKAEAYEYVSQKFNLDAPYLLNVGTIEPRKNIIGLLKAFKELKEQYKIPHVLLIAGAKGWNHSDIFSMYKELSLEGVVKFIGYVDDHDMPFLYSGADIFIYPSLYEGFGMPVLEAMACGCCVVTSNNSSFPEVVGDCGVLVNPDDYSGIAKSTYDFMSDKELMAACRMKGIERSKIFSWDSSAKIILETLLKL